MNSGLESNHCVCLILINDAEPPAYWIVRIFHLRWIWFIPGICFFKGTGTVTENAFWVKGILTEIACNMTSAQQGIQDVYITTCIKNSDE